MVLKPLVKVSVQIVVLYQYGILDFKYLPMLIADLMYQIFNSSVLHFIAIVKFWLPILPSKTVGGQFQVHLCVCLLS